VALAPEKQVVPVAAVWAAHILLEELITALRQQVAQAILQVHLHHRVITALMA
jgi:hypothetical protein